MATYSTDLTTLTTAESGTWTEFASPYNGGGTPGLSGEQFIQGIDCYSQNTGKAVGLAISCVFNNGTPVTFAAGEAVFAWFFYFAGTNLQTTPLGGWRFGIGSSTSAWDWFTVGGSNYGNQKYGGWFNFAIDPTASETGTVGGGNGGTYQYFGNVPYTLNEVTKGDPVAVDAIRKGRGILSITGTGGSFSQLAQYNDYNAGGTPPGTSSTSIDSGRHVLGLFQQAGGTYLWKGLLSFGTAAASVTFSDANETIIIDDCPNTYSSFNKIEIRNVGSSVTLDSITFISTATTDNGRGNFEMIDNAPTFLNNCTFPDMGTFIFKSSGSLGGSIWRRSNLVTQGGATFNGCSFINSLNSSSLASNNPTKITNNLFQTGSLSATNHAIELLPATAGNTYSLIGNEFVGYNIANGSTGKEVIYNNSGGAVTLNVSDTIGTVSYRNGTGASTTINNNVAVTLTGLKDNTEVRVLAFGTNTELAGTENATDGTTNNRSFTFSLPAATATTIVIHNLQYVYISLNYTIPGSSATLPIQQQFDRYFSNL